jgi:predicted nucleotidyltransferase
LYKGEQYSKNGPILIYSVLFVIFDKMKSNMPKDAILQTLIAHKQQLAAYGVNQIGLFGSHLRNEATENSDIDLLVDLRKEKKTFNNFLSLNYFLEDLFGCKVELVTTQSLSPYIGPHILKTVAYAPIAD